MHLKLSCYQFKIDCYNYEMLYISRLLSRKQESIVHTKMIKRKESKHTTTENYQITNKKNKRRRKEQKKLQKQPENYLQNGNSKIIPVTNYFKFM